MSDPILRVRLEEIDWSSALPVLKLFRSFRMAIHPMKLLVGLFLVFLLNLGGWVLDYASHSTVYAGELEQYVKLSPVEFDRWQEGRKDWMNNRLREITTQTTINQDNPFPQIIQEIDDYYIPRMRAVESQPGGQRELDNLRQERLEKLQLVRSLKPKGVFATALSAELEDFQRLMHNAMALRFGLTELIGMGTSDQGSVMSNLKHMLVDVPVWLAQKHRTFLIIFGCYGLLLWAFIGGILARMAMLDIAPPEPTEPPEHIPATGSGKEGSQLGRAIGFIGRRWLWFVMAPLIPLILAGLIGLLMTLAGVVFFNWPVLDVLGGLGFVVLLVLGLVVSLLLLGQVGAFNLMYPAIAAEGSDAIDAVSRCFHYVYRQPWKWSFTTLLALVYGAICHMFLTVVVFLALAATHFFVNLGVWRDVRPGVGRFDAILPAPALGALTYDMDTSVLGTSGKLAGVLVGIWVSLCIGLLAAFAVSFYFCANSWIYLLLRKASDGTALEEIAGEALGGGHPMEAKVTPPDAPAKTEATELPVDEPD